MELNREQQEIIAATEGVKLVVSGPGTGKTTTITHFLAKLLATGKARPEQILAVTFTNKAAREMRNRVKELTGVTPDVFTIHSFARRVLVSFPPPGYTSGFSMLENETPLIKNLLKRTNPNMHPQEAKEIMTLARNSRDNALLTKHNLVQFYNLYMQQLKRSNMMDFDGLLTWCVSTFEKNPLALQEFSKKYRYLLVDEFQDTSRLQYALLLPLAKATGNLLCVGDYDQSIYSFRGADVNLILNLERDFPNLATHYLKENYRCTKKIVRAANALIVNNKKRLPKPHLTNRPQGEPITRKGFANVFQEAEYVAQEIATGKKTGTTWADFAVLYRVNNQNIPLAKILSEKSIPFQVVGDEDYFDLKEIKNILCFYKLILNPKDQEAQAEVLNVLGNLGHKRVNLGEVVEALAKGKNLIGIYTAILEDTGMKLHLASNNSQAGLKALENVLELESILADFGDKGIEPFLEFTRIARSSDSDDAVNLLTIHKAKGLEFDTVFIIGVDEDMIPYYQNQSGEGLEEERRMFYVAITRAKNRVHLTYPRERQLQRKKAKTSPSRFLGELRLEQERFIPTSVANVRNVAAAVHHQPDYKAEALSSRKANPQGPWRDSSGNRWGICKRCSQFTRDWWSLDGATNMCECNDCKFK